MRNSLMVIVLLIFSCFNKTADKPKLSVKLPEIDLGDVRYDSSFELNYVILNSGKKTLVIDTVSTSCGCSTPSFLKKVIEVSDSAILAITYKPVDTGFFNKTIVLKSNIDSEFTLLSFRGRAFK